jgi:hypothetical protein
MLRTLRRWLALVITTCALTLPAAHGQPTATTTKDPPGTTPPADRTYPAEIFIAFLAVALVLVVVCMPSRKQL